MPSKPNPPLSEIGFLLTSIELPAQVAAAVTARNWPELDALIHAECRPGGGIYSRLCEYGEFSEIEYLIAIRSSDQEPDEDGIWHDDGSRTLAFSLSLNFDPETIEGGKLEIKKRTESESSAKAIPTPPYGTAIVFATGRDGFEHRIRKVSRGERIIIAGWCT